MIRGACSDWVSPWKSDLCAWDRPGEAFSPWNRIIPYVSYVEEKRRSIVILYPKTGSSLGCMVFYATQHLCLNNSLSCYVSFSNSHSKWPVQNPFSCREEWRKVRLTLPNPRNNCFHSLNIRFHSDEEFLQSSFGKLIGKREIQTLMVLIVTGWSGYSNDERLSYPNI